MATRLHRLSVGRTLGRGGEDFLKRSWMLGLSRRSRLLGAKGLVSSIGGKSV